jgi:ribosome-associated toxin RatA of RatAB toxin-antitoxin module
MIMHVLKRTALVPYSDKQMFELVNNIEDYPQFLPWCHTSRIISRTEKEVIAELEIRWKGIHKSFTTRNILYPNERMDIVLVTGPLAHLDASWRFVPLDEKACKIALDMEFDFTHSFMDLLFQPIFQHIANTFVDAFCNRAKELYGKDRLNHD